MSSSQEENWSPHEENFKPLVDKATASSMGCTVQWVSVILTHGSVIIFYWGYILQSIESGLRVHQIDGAA